MTKKSITDPITGRVVVTSAHAHDADRDRCICGGQIVWFEDGDRDGRIGEGCEVARVIWLDDDDDSAETTNEGEANMEYKLYALTVREYYGPDDLDGTLVGSETFRNVDEAKAEGAHTEQLLNTLDARLQGYRYQTFVREI